MQNLTKISITNFIRDRGKYFGIIGVPATSISVIVAFFLYISVNPTFNMVSNCVSDLGTGPNMSNVAYSIGSIITGFCQVPFYLSLVKYLQNQKANTYLIKITKFTFLISALGLIVLGIIPFEKETLVFFLGHGSAAATHYIAGSIAFILCGLFEIFILRLSKILGVISFLTGTLYALQWIGFLIDFIFKIPQLHVNYTLQWINLAGILLWSLLHTIFLFNTKKFNNDSFI
jgi:hypothetical membrane protein